MLNFPPNKIAEYKMWVTWYCLTATCSSGTTTRTATITATIIGSTIASIATAVVLTVTVCAANPRTDMI